MSRPVRALAAGGIVGMPLALAACSNSADRPAEPRLRQSSSNYGTPSAHVASGGTAMPKGGGVFKVGQPYTMGGRWYVPREEPGYDRTGLASWYGTDFHGRKTANGETYDMNALTAAHPTLPMPSYVYVTNLASGRTILVRVNDRGPYVADRLIDLSARAARLLGSAEAGVAQVRVRFAGYAPSTATTTTSVGFSPPSRGPPPHSSRRRSRRERRRNRPVHALRCWRRLRVRPWRRSASRTAGRSPAIGRRHRGGAASAGRPTGGIETPGSSPAGVQAARLRR